MSKWQDNPDAVLLSNEVFYKQAYDLPYPPYAVIYTNDHFAQEVERLVPNKRRRNRALKQILEATSCDNGAWQIKAYLGIVKKEGKK